MDPRQKLQLQEMIKANDTTDQTELIRDLKHSHLLKDDISKMMLNKGKYVTEGYDKTREVCMNDCSFLFTYYTDIFNKVLKDEIDIGILGKFLDVLARIEEGELNQHEGSFLVGTLLKELYIDSALRKSDKLDKQYVDENGEEVPEVKPIEISWSQYKQHRNGMVTK
jgi:hypothetical protein